MTLGLVCGFISFLLSLYKTIRPTLGLFPPVGNDSQGIEIATTNSHE